MYSCAASLTKNKKITITHSSDEKVELTSITYGTKTKEEESGGFKISNKEKGFVISTQKDNYYTNSKVITRKKFNYYKLIDVFIPLASNIAMLTVKAGSIPLVAEAAITLTGIFWWIPAFRGPWKVYDNQYQAPTPNLPYPKRTANQGFISAMELNMNVPKENHTAATFSDYSNFLEQNNKGKMAIGTLPSEKKVFERKELSVLDKFNFRDSTNNFFVTKLTDLKLVLDIKTLEEKLILTAKQLHVKTEVSLMNNFSNTPILTKTIEANTQWRRNITFHGPFSYQNQEDFLDNVLAKFLSEPDVQQALIDYKEKQQNKEGEKFDYLTIAAVQEGVKTIPEAVKAVVTVVTKDGHGSGCVISNNGYIVTNSHVIANNDTNITVLFSDSTHHKAKLIVANLDDDLALIKIDTTLSYCFNIDNTKSIEIGTEVYAIGAYNIDDYTVSISKGIISSFRKVDGKDFIQTDVTINSGNSGGALINIKGELLGVVTAKMVGKGIEGIGFVIPYNKIKESLKIKFE